MSIHLKVMGRETSRRGQVFLQNILLMNLISSWLQLKECRDRVNFLHGHGQMNFCCFLMFLEVLGRCSPSSLKSALVCFLEML